MHKLRSSGRLVGIALLVSLLVAVLAISCSGPTGPAGSPGAPGLAGPVGATGAQGIQGVQGVSGPAGMAGGAGPAGPAGDKGPQGPAGPAGLKGGVGAAGAAGAAGATGPAGAAAPQPAANITVHMTTVGTATAYSVWGSGFAVGEKVSVMLANVSLGSATANASGAFELAVDNTKLPTTLGIYTASATGDMGSMASDALKIK